MSPASADEPSPPAGVHRRVAAGALDALLLGLGFGLLSITELALASQQETDIALYAWVFVLAPLYFALYHAYGTGATPGQLELRIGLRDARSGERPSLARALARSLLGLVFLATIVPALVELALLCSGRSLRDRLTRTRVETIRLHGKAPQLAEPTAPELTAIFEPEAGTRRYLRRGWALLRARPRLVLGPVAAVYAVLFAVAVVLGLLLVADSDDIFVLFFYVQLVVALLASGVFWAQAVLVTAVEQARVGGSTSVWRTLVLTSRRANALSAALVGLLLVAASTVLTSFLTTPVLARLALIAPALVLEDTRVLGAFGRSWQLTRGQTWRLVGLLVLSGGILGLGASILSGLLAPAGDSVAGAIVAVAVLGVAFVVLLAWVGAAWSLVYEDARRVRPPGAAS